MALELATRQAQRQVASPAMMMEMSLLALPIADLREAVRKEVDSNPALEIAPALSPCRSPSASGDKDGFLENVADERGETLDEHLLGELRMAGVGGRELELCRAIVSYLDADGRFTGTFADLRMVTGANERDLEAARRRVMTIEPLGCGARDLAECYRAQLKSVPEGKRDAVARAIDYVAAVQSGERALGADAPDAAALRLLKTLDPFPGRQYDSRRTEVVVPDVRLDGDGRITVDRGDVPELRVSPKYVAMAKDRELDEETRLYAAERVRRARDFREAVVRRLETVEKIAEIALSDQEGFLDRGAAGLRRQTMTEVAGKAKCTVSTVSRAAARKYVRTPRGTLPLRRFFVLVDQEPVEKLREILERVWYREHPSDRALSEMMSAAGHPMARRTVAKYRARLGFKAIGTDKNGEDLPTLSAHARTLSSTVCRRFM